MTDLEESRQRWLGMTLEVQSTALEARRAEAHALEVACEAVAARARADLATQVAAQRLADLREALEGNS